MNEYQEPVVVQSAAAPRWVALAVAIVAILSLIGLGVGWSAISHANNFEQSTQASLKQTNDTLGQRLTKAEEQNQQLQSDLKVCHQQAEANARRINRRTQADQIRDRGVREEASGLESSVNTELATKASADDFNRLNGDVTGVKGDLDATKNSIQMARSEMARSSPVTMMKSINSAAWASVTISEFALNAQERTAKSRRYSSPAKIYQRKKEPLHVDVRPMTRASRRKTVL